MSLQIKIPIMTPPSPNEWPNTIRPITGITRAPEASVTCPDHGFTAADVGLTSIMFQQVRGMNQINGLPAVITAVPTANTFNCNLDTTNFFAYTSGGVVNILTGQPPVTTQGQQIFNTPFENIA